MHFASFEVTNYKRFASSGRMVLGPGFNVIVGRNNVGKTSLADAMGMRFGNKPHRSRKTVPTRGTYVNPRSAIEVSISLEVDELRQLMYERLPIFYVAARNREADAEEALFRQVTSDGVTIDATYGSGGEVLSVTTSGYGSRASGDDFLKFQFDRSTDEIRRDGALWGAPSGDGPEFAS